MSSKLNVKPSKKERPRSSDKIRKGKERGTPEKPTTPNASQDAFAEEGADPDKRVIINDEILAMQIKPEHFEQMREPKPPSKPHTPKATSVVVRKLKPASEWDKPKPKIVTVAKPAPQDATLKAIDYEGAAGPRFDAQGNILPHSILGSVEDFKKHALQTGDYPEELLTPRKEDTQTLSVKYQKKTKSQFPKFESVEESNALNNWQKRMVERRKQQNHLSRVLNKEPDKLVMNQADAYRKTQELRYLIDRTIPSMDYGKGYRVGSEFWQQQERVGNDLAGIHMTLKQTDKGYPPPVEHIGVPKTILTEKGSNWERPRTPFHKPWHKSPYLGSRKYQLQHVMDELDPHTPETRDIEIIGKNKPHQVPRVDILSEEDMQETAGLREEMEERMAAASVAAGGVPPPEVDSLAAYPDVHAEPVFGPSLQFAGQAARWTGDSTSFVGQVGVEARVTFEAFSGERITSYLEVVNDGTTCIYFDWKKIPKSNPLEVVSAKVQRFYFNTSSGCVLPGDTVKVPFVFKSPNAGVFSEQWQLETRPVVCGGAALVVTLRGVALQKDKFKQQRTELEEELANKQAEQIVDGILNQLLDGIQSPDRPASPVDAYITEQETFSRQNPKLNYNCEVVKKLKQLYLAVVPPPGDDEELLEGEEPEDWDLSVKTLEDMLMSMDEDAEQKQDLLQQLNNHVSLMAFPDFTPKQQQMYSVGYQLLAEALDDMVTQAVSLRSSLGLPEHDADIAPEDTTRSHSPGADSVTSTTSNESSHMSVRRGGSPTRHPGSRPPSNTRPTSGAHSTDSAPRPKDKPAPGLSRSPTRGDMRTPASRDGKKLAKGKNDPKDKKGGKDAKGGGKAAAKDPSKGKISTGKRPPTREKDRVQSPPSGQQSPTASGTDPILTAKYRDKLHTQAYITMMETVDKMASMFESIEEQSGGMKLPNMF